MSVTITFLEQKTRGVPDTHASLHVPDGPLTPIPQETTSGKLRACRSTFRARESRETLGRPFPCVEAGDLYLIWIEERTEWIGFEYWETSEYEVYWSEHSVHLRGPYQLNARCAELIREAFGSPDIPSEAVLRTALAELETT